jgi:hypothetical protein
VPWRTISIAMARQLSTGRTLRNFHGNPPVEVAFTRLGTTVAMCGESGISFANLLVEQFQEPLDGNFSSQLTLSLPSLPLPSLRVPFPSRSLLLSSRTRSCILLQKLWTNLAKTGSGQDRTAALMITLC